MAYARLRRQLAATLSVLLVGSPIATAQVDCPTPIVPPNITDRDGYLVLLEEPPIHPMELVANGSELWVTNLIDASVSVFNVLDTGNLRLQREIPVCLGPVTIRERPGGGPLIHPGEPGLALATRNEIQPVGHKEVWVSCHSSHAVAIINSSTKRIEETIRLEYEPADLVFSANGNRAYVALSSSNQIAEINANTRSVLNVFEFDSEYPLGTGVRVHAEEPRSLLLMDDELFGLSFKSGNGTTNDRFDLDCDGDVLDILQIWDLPSPCFGVAVDPPDRDVFRFDVNAPSGSTALWRMGTMNFDLELGTNGDLYVSTVDLDNDTREHKFDYKANGFSRHLVAHAPPAGPGPQPPPAEIDLNDPNQVDAGLLAQGYACAMPNEMAFSEDGSRLYVACYETRNTAVIDTATDMVIADLVPPAVATTGWGPRGVVLNEGRSKAYVFNRADSEVHVFDIPVAVGSRNVPVQTIASGFDITPDKIVEGRRHFIDASFSGTGLETCNTCHIDGDLDGLAWDLADFTGDLPAVPVARDDNNIKVTMSLRGIEETAPFHWQGNRDDLVDFNEAFDGLLGAPFPFTLPPTDFDEFQAFVFALSYPANTEQNASPGGNPDFPERGYSPQANLGFGCFDTIPVVTSSIDTSGFPDANGNFNPAGRITQTCSECHAMADAAQGTNNQLNNDVVGIGAGDATQLRGLFDKLSDIAIPGAVNATGYGLFNNGSVLQVLDFTFAFFQDTLRAQQVEDFILEMDSGLASSTAYTWTLNQASSAQAGSTPTELFQMPEATNGDSDLVVRGWTNVTGTPTAVKGLFNRATGVFDMDTSALGSLSFNQLVTRAAAGNGVFTFVGTPLLSGYRLGLDGDMDQVIDGDEAGLGISPRNPDSDGDSFPDGHELANGSIPSNPASIPLDLVAPVISGESVGWVESEVARVRWSTDEAATSRVRVIDQGTGFQIYSADEIQPKTDHTMVIRGINPERSYDVILEAFDPATNMGSSSVLSGASGVFTQPHAFRSLHIDSTQMTVTGPIPFLGFRYLVQADFTVVDESLNLVNGTLVRADLVEWVPGSGVNQIQTATAGPSVGGVASVLFLTNNVGGAGAKAEVKVNLSNQELSVIDTALGPTGGMLHRLYFHPLDHELQYWAQADLP